jgi:hypothetical protein
MKPITAWFWATAILCSGALGLARGELKATTLAKPMPVKVTLAGTFENIDGSLIRYDAASLVIRTDKGERDLKWLGLTRLTQYALRKQLVDPKSAAEWRDLAQLAMKLDMGKEAEIAFANAARIDPASKGNGVAMLSGTAPAPAPAAAAPELVDVPEVGAVSTTPRLALRNATSKPGIPAKGAKYQKATPEEHAEAIAYAEQRARIVADGMHIKLETIKTAHFIIFTNWDPLEYRFLKTNCENAYSAVSRQFDIPVTENVFVGLLPVFMFVTRDEFAKYANEYDKLPVPADVSGYFTQHADGGGHMVMWKPIITKTGVGQAEERWGHTLTHEFTHAFISRYRSNQWVPRWLNEGLAEVIASGPFPRSYVHPYAKMMAGKKFDFQALFDDKQMPPGEMYPVMQTMVEALIGEDRKAFLKMFDDIKDGMDPEAAMRKNYKAGYADWEKAWRNYAKNLPNN